MQFCPVLKSNITNSSKFCVQRKMEVVFLKYVGP